MSPGPRYGSLSELQQAIQSGQTTVKAATQEYLSVIENLNGENHAITVTNQNALADAERLDVRPMTPGGQRGPYSQLSKDTKHASRDCN